MSAISRNALCPCGSGRKYKRCCLPKDAERERKLSIGPRAIRGLSDSDEVASSDEPSGTWHADLMPIPVTLDAAPNSRAALGLVVSANDIVIVAEAIAPAPSELDEITDIIESLLERGAALAGTWPSMVRVRHPQIRALLAPRLAARGTNVRTARKLPALDRARQSLAASVFGVDEPDALSAFVGDWSKWGAPSELIAEVFAASTVFRKAQPWRSLSERESFRAVVPGGATWTVLVMGHTGKTFGISLFEQYNDVRRLQERAEEDSAFAAVQGQMLSLSFDAGRDLPRAFRDDVKWNLWTLPAPDVYPVLTTGNTPAGGVTRRQLSDLAGILRAMAELSTSLDTALADEKTPGVWTHPATGVHLLFDRDELAFALAADDWSPLTSSGPEGLGADPSARLDVDAIDAEANAEMTVVGRFDEWRRATVDITEGDGGAGDRDAANAELFVNFLAHQQGVPVRAVTEYDLRVFLHDWVHRKAVMSDEQSAGLLASLERFFEYLAAREEIVCPWAHPVFADVASYRHRRATFPGGFWWDVGLQEWQAKLGFSLIARVLVHDSAGPSPDAVGGAAMLGPVEGKLESELQRLWLVWRDELVRAGVTDRGAVIDALIQRRGSWERTPNAITRGETPRHAVAKERQRRS